MRAAHALVTDGGSPLCDRDAEGEISEALDNVLDLLELR
jgi:hypothetical protein